MLLDRVGGWERLPPARRLGQALMGVSSLAARNRGRAEGVRTCWRSLSSLRLNRFTRPVCVGCDAAEPWPPQLGLRPPA
eukprot:14220864-Alexandrium_andersonii.AAC.1